jgi:signal transduction histidine kinase
VGPFVARHLVEAMGGRVWARNRPEGGVEMAFALPVDRG